MDSGFYAACAGLVARTQALELAANNLANASTTGYRAQKEVFRQVIAGQRNGTALNRAVNSFGVVGGTRTDLRQGNLERTGDALDLGIEGPGFFAVESSAGTQYTRDGNFQIRADRILVTADGRAVLGDQGPIRVPEGTPSVSDDGTLSLGGALAGRLRIVEFPPGVELTPAGSGYFTAPAAAALRAQRSAVRQGMLESSNVDAVSAVVSLIALQRHAESMQRTLSVFHNEFNRIAAEELPRT